MYLMHLLPGWSCARRMFFVTKLGENIEGVMGMSWSVKEDHKQP